MEEGGQKQQVRKRKPGGGRKRKNPLYDAETILKNLQEAAAAAYQETEPAEDGSVHHPTLAQIGEKIGANPIKVRKLLITAGVYESEIADQVRECFRKYQKLFEAQWKSGGENGLEAQEKPGGRSDAESFVHKHAIEAVMRELKLSRASVTSYLPYSKTVYFPAGCDTDCISAGAQRVRRIRERGKLSKRFIRQLEQCGFRPKEREFTKLADELWQLIVIHQGCHFKTVGGLNFTYRVGEKNGVAGRELFFDRKEKSITKSTVDKAFQKALELVAADRESGGKGKIQGPKKLGTFGASYIYGIFVRIGIVCPQ